MGKSLIRTISIGSPVLRSDPRRAEAWKSPAVTLEPERPGKFRNSLALPAESVPSRFRRQFRDSNSQLPASPAQWTKKQKVELLDRWMPGRWRLFVSIKAIVQPVARHYGEDR